MPRHPLPAIAAAVALVALALSGCGGDPGPEVATAATGAPTADASATGGGAVAEYLAAQRQWVGCMREHGYELPDPDSRGRVDVNLRQIGVTDKTDPRFIQAQQDCRRFSREVPEELLEREVLTADQIAHRRAYAKCMREHGDESFPDPEPDGTWPRRANPGGSEQGAEQGYRAGLTCAPVLDGKPADPNATPPPDAKG
ncbi:hypothetical protein [Rhizomonospora bruguierae]|uniref:hypothetical protein n=1 Tax=Rhizomonospora bruguierae TaxID=1581705 RepID=UPI001BCCD38B|nr:hypothetical protein [Micromonospora sp. NBRC 107566]